MKDFPIDDAFDQLCTSVFRLEATWKMEDGSLRGGVATAFAIDKRSSGELVLATAKHAFDFPHEATINWRIQQFDDHSRLQRETLFGTSKTQKADVPYRYHKKYDVGFIALPGILKQATGEPFSLPDEQPLAMIGEKLMVGIGARVCWAGFPGQIEGFLKEPALCYAEGVISSMVNRDDRHLYIVDGHNSPGFSGGPVWYWCEDRQEFLVLGIVSLYLSNNVFPGFCAFEPINEVKFFLNFWDREDAKSTEPDPDDGTQPATTTFVRELDGTR